MLLFSSRSNNSPRVQVNSKIQSANSGDTIIKANEKSLYYNISTKLYFTRL